MRLHGEHALVELGFDRVRIDRISERDVVAIRALAALAGDRQPAVLERQLEIAPPSALTWSELLALAGVTPKPVARWRARVGRWFGARTFDVATSSPAPP